MATLLSRSQPTTLPLETAFQLRARIVVPLIAAILLSFGRTGMLRVLGMYTPFDAALNYFVLIAAPLFGLIGLIQIVSGRYLLMMVPLALTFAWIAVRMRSSAEEFWTTRSAVISICLAILIGSQITRWELRRLRHCLLFLAALFTVLVLIYGQRVLTNISTGWMKVRLGEEFTPANVVAFPRSLYALVFACVASVVLERNIIIRIAAVGLMIIPAAIAFATGGRGALVGLIAAILIFIAAMGRNRRTLISIFIVGIIVGIGYFMVEAYFPILVSRIASESDSGRFVIYREALQDVSLLGRGPSWHYAHNVFLEFWQDYGIVGFTLFLSYFSLVVRLLWRCYESSRDREILFLLGIFTLHLVGQQFSLNIFWAFFWTAMVLPLGVAATSDIDGSTLRGLAGR